MMPRPSQDGVEVQAMRSAWEALRSARVEAQSAYQDALAAVDRVEGAQFLVSVQDAKRAGLAKYTVSRATGVRAWPKIREWWGDDVPVSVAAADAPMSVVGGDVMVPVVRERITTFTVDGYELNAVDRLGVTQIFLNNSALYAVKDSDDVVSWFQLPDDGGEDESLSFTERVDLIPDVVENAVKDNVWIAAHE